MLVGKKPTGTLVLDGLRPGKNLYMLGTGTGLAPFLSLVRDPETYERYEKVIVTHTVRQVADLNYREFLSRELPNDEILGELCAPKLIYYPTVTREPFEHQGRITDLIASGQLFTDIGLPPFDPARDRVMLCGGPSRAGRPEDPAAGPRLRRGLGRQPRRLRPRAGLRGDLSRRSLLTRAAGEGDGEAVEGARGPTSPSA